MDERPDLDSRHPTDPLAAAAAQPVEQAHQAGVVMGVLRRLWREPGDRVHVKGAPLGVGSIGTVECAYPGQPEVVDVWFDDDVGGAYLALALERHID